MDEFIANRLKKIRVGLNLSQTDFAKSLNISQGVISDIEKGRKGLSRNVLLSLGTVYNVNANWLLTGEGNPTKAKEPLGSGSLASVFATQENVDNALINNADVTTDQSTFTSSFSSNTFVVPFLDQKLSAGNGSVIPEEDTTTALVEVPRYLQKYGKDLAALTVDGDSMEPTLSRGDMVVCDSCGWDGEGIYAIQMNGNGFVKRLSHKPGKVVIISDNPLYETWEESLESENIRIIGRVHCALKVVE